MNILVMGGTNFISRSLAEHFIQLGYNVDLFTRGLRPVEYTGFRSHIIGDRHNKEDILKITEAYDYILDIASYTRDDVKLLIEHIDTSKIKRYLYCSSGAVYKPSEDLIDENFEKGENHNWRKYGLDKLEAEEFLIASGLPYTIFRPTYVYGPNNTLYRESYFFDQMTKGLGVKYPKNKASTQFIHIHDFCLIIQSFMENKISINEAYNITHEHIYTFEDMLSVYEQATGLTMIKVPVSKEEEAISRKYFPYRDVTYTLSNDKLKKHGLHVPKFDLLEGLKQTYEWYKRKSPVLSDKAMIDIIK